MKKRIGLLGGIALACVLVLGGGYWGINAFAGHPDAAHPDTPTMKNQPNFKPIMAEANEIASHHTINSKLVRKWTIREYAAMKARGEKADYDKAYQKALQDVKKSNAWFTVAQNEYGVQKPQGKELDDWITKNVDSISNKQQEQAAAGLGMSTKEMNHKFDRDLYQKNMMWQELKPKVIAKHNLEDGNNTAAVKAYQQEVQEYMNQH